MKIGLLLPSVYMGQKYKDKIFAPKELFLNLADGLVSQGHEVYVYAAPGTKTKAHVISGVEGLIAHDLKRFRGLNDIVGRKVAHVVTKIEYEIDLTVKAYLHAQEKKIDIMHLYHDFFAHYVNRTVQIKTVHTIHDPLPLQGHLEYWRLKHFSKDNYIFISHSQRNHFKDLVHAVGVVYHGIEISRFPFGEGEGGYLAFLGRYVREKGVNEAISAAKKANVLFKMIGSDEHRSTSYYKEKILPYLKKGMIEDETFFGKADRGSFLKNGKALLFPILWEEPFGMVMIEAMACGTPVIAYNRGSVPEIVRDGLTGFIIDPDNEDRPGKGTWIIKKQGAEGLVEAVRRIREIDRNACRKHIQENFSVEKMVGNYERLYQEMINKK